MAKINEVQVIEQLKDNECFVVITADGSLHQTKKSAVIRNLGADATTALFDKKGWYRICIGAVNNHTTSAILNFGLIYGNTNPCSACLYFAGSGYSGCVVNTIGKLGTVFSKIRFLVRASTTDKPFLDVYYNCTTPNTVSVSMSSAVFVKLDNVRYVGDEIPSGYSAKEFDL